jgi:hypothetical protein
LTSHNAENLLDMYPVSTHPAGRGEDGLIKIDVPKFNNIIGRSFCNLLRLGDTFVVSLDEIGSYIYERCDGGRSVRDITLETDREFGERVEPCVQRVAEFIKSLELNGLVKVENKAV